MLFIERKLFNETTTSTLKKFQIKALIALTLMSGGFISQPASALGLSTFRIYLDQSNREYNFIVFNRDGYQQDCQVYLRHYQIDDAGNKTLLDDNEIPSQSAKGLLRFSPKRFKLDNGESQSIRFQMRRKANQPVGEFRSYLSLDCGMSEEALKAQSDQSVLLQPKLRHNIPIIVRTGDIDVNVSIDNVQLNGKSAVNGRLSKNGNRSVYGDIELIDVRDNSVIAKKPLASIHVESKYYDFTLSTRNVDPKFLKLRFIEDKAVGGDKIIETSVL